MCVCACVFMSQVQHIKNFAFAEMNTVLGWFFRIRSLLGLLAGPSSIRAGWAIETKSRFGTE